MKKYLLIFIAIFIPIGVLVAQETTRLHMSFNEKQFAFSFNSINALEISLNDPEFVSTYGNDTNEPCLPLIDVEVKVPQGATFENVFYDETRKLLFENVSIEANPNVVPTSEILSTDIKPNVNYSLRKYPAEQVKYVTSSNFDGYTIMHFQVCPFVYDALNKNLYLLDNVNIDINCKRETASNTDKRERFVNFCNENKINFEKYTSSLSSVSDVNGIGDSIDYLIITSKELSYYFQPFVQWKITKGIRTAITTIEEIQEMDKSSFLSLADRIKAYLLYLYHIKGYKFKYLLLGGDDSIVPSKKCYSYVMGTKQKEMVPTDIFYACLDYKKDPFWDASGNGICGELEDSIDFSQDIFVTRLPVNTSTDVKNTQLKLVMYEQNPSINGWHNSILMSGCKLSFNNNDGHSDAEYAGDIIYNNSIGKYWDGERVKLYDTHSDLDSIDTLTPSSFIKALANGYSFIDMITHGNYTWWNLPNNQCYDHILACDMKSKQYSVITTIACKTNGFDMEEPCLSEAFIRNPNSGVIAYLGSSRAGWYYENNFKYSGPSAQYEEAFYKYLFSEELKDKNFGKVVAYAKNSKLASCGTYHCGRWLLYNLNPIGDSEMPIYTTVPKSFSDSRIRYTRSKIIIRTGIEDCKICVMSSKDYGKTYYKVYNNVENIILDKVNTDLKICITKQNYIPKIYEIKASLFNRINATITDLVNTGNKFVAEVELGENVKDAMLTISSAEGNKVASYDVSCESPYVQMDVSSIRAGVYIVSLITNGIVVDSKQIIKKK